MHDPLHPPEHPEQPLQPLEHPDVHPEPHPPVHPEPHPPLQPEPHVPEQLPEHPVHPVQPPVQLLEQDNEHNPVQFPLQPEFESVEEISNKESTNSSALSIVFGLADLSLLILLSFRKSFTCNNGSIIFLICSSFISDDSLGVVS